MKKPHPSLLIVNPELIIKFKNATLWFENNFHLALSQLLNFYKLLNTSVRKRVVNEYKSLIGEFAFHNLLFIKYIGTSPMRYLLH